MAARLTGSLLITSFCLLIFSGQLLASNIPAAPPDYGRLLDFIQEEDLTDPLIVFGGAEKDFDRQLNRENIAYLNENRQLMQRIQDHLKGDHIKWQLNTSFKQVWVVPEVRDEYAQLFERYCREAVAYLTARLEIPSPYESIATLHGPLPDLQQKGHNGLTAYLVHNVADEYIEEYLFFDQGDDTTQIKIKLSNREFDGKIGCYTSKLKIGADNHFEFIHENFTLWQNSAQNPLNVLIVPVEETLHIMLRTATEQAIHDELTLLKPQHISEVKAAIDRWMQVEEAVVGGLVYQVMPNLWDHVVHGASEFPLAGSI